MEVKQKFRIIYSKEAVSFPATMEQKDFYTADEAKDILFGETGTQERDEYESELKECLIDEAINAR